MTHAPSSKEHAPPLCAVRKRRRAAHDSRIDGHNAKIKAPSGQLAAREIAMWWLLRRAECEEAKEEVAAEEAPAAEEEAPAAEAEAEAEPEEEKRNIEVKTSPFDARFPTVNQAKNCYTRYNEFHKCAKEKDAEDPACQKYASFYRSICPTEWVDRWNEQRENGNWPGRY